MQIVKLCTITTITYTKCTEYCDILIIICLGQITSNERKYNTDDVTSVIYLTIYNKKKELHETFNSDFIQEVVTTSSSGPEKSTQSIDY